MHFLAARLAKPVVQLAIDSDSTNYNVFVAAGSPSSSCDVVVTIGQNVWVYSNSISSPAMQIGTGWATGSTVKIINGGYIAGHGGLGGHGGDGGGGTGPTAGGNGSDALELDGNYIDLDNTNGFIYGGGRGGDGGAGSNYSISDAGGGGGGGGGIGKVGGTHGTHGDGFGGSPAGQDGVDGSQYAGGAGGAGGSPHAQSGQYGSTWGYGSKAISLSGGSVQWLGGNNYTQVKGSVS